MSQVRSGPICAWGLSIFFELPFNSSNFIIPCAFLRLYSRLLFDTLGDSFLGSATIQKYPGIDRGLVQSRGRLQSSTTTTSIHVFPLSFSAPRVVFHLFKRVFYSLFCVYLASATLGHMIVLSFSTLSLINSKVKIGFEYGIIIIKFPERSLFRRL